MATINGSTNNSQWTFKLEATEIATSIENKTSTVRVQTYLGRASSQSYLGGNYNLSVKCAGQTQNQNGNIPYPTYINGGSWYLLKTFTFTVSNTGNPTIIDISSTMTSSDFSPSSSNANGKLTLSQLHEAPFLIGISFQETNSILSSTGIPSDTFVPYLSIKKATIEATTYDNATITKTKLLNGSNTFESSTTTPEVVTMDFTKNELVYHYDNFQEKNMVDLSVELTDSMGGVSKYGYPNTWVVPYIKPNLITTSSNIKRNGQVSGKVNLNLTGTFYNDKIGSKSNTISLSYKYWKKGATEPTTYITIPTSAYTISGNNFSIKNWNIANNGVVIEDVAKDSVYIFKIRIVDSFNSDNEIELLCPKGEWLRALFKDRIDFKRITIGGNDIVESGENENGTYIKYYDGRMICTGKVSTGILTWSQDTIIWHSRYHNLPDFPKEFIEPPHVVKSIEKTTPAQRSVWINGISEATTTNAGTYGLSTYWNATDTSCIITYIAVGKWK
jgi:hypothetical protein